MKLNFLDAKYFDRKHTYALAFSIFNFIGHSVWNGIGANISDLFFFLFFAILSEVIENFIQIVKLFRYFSGKTKVYRVVNQNGDRN